jgi:hypothetical protein
MIACIDENLGALWQRLKDWELAENTILIFMTDNGTSGGATLDREQHVVAGYNAGMRGIKGSEYEGGHRVPLFIHWPAGGIDRGRDIPELTGNVDVMPTLLDLCGIDAGEHEDGSDWADRIMVTDSQRLAHPVKWRKSATMSQRWRLVNGVELYDILADPGQRHDVAAEHPDVVARLREGYVAWWAKVSRQFDGTIPIPIGCEETERVRLTTHDWRNDPVACAWNQSQIRAGLECNGYWEVDVARPGRYRFELRRWPREEALAIPAGIPGPLKPFRAEIKHGWGGGRAIPVVSAAIQVAGYEETKPVPPDAEHVEFIADLNAGETRLQTYLTCADGTVLGAYYVYVERLS